MTEYIKYNFIEEDESLKWLYLNPKMPQRAIRKFVDVY